MNRQCCLGAHDVAWAVQTLKKMEMDPWCGLRGGGFNPFTIEPMLWLGGFNLCNIGSGPVMRLGGLSPLKSGTGLLTLTLIDRFLTSARPAPAQTTSLRLCSPHVSPRHLWTRGPMASHCSETARYFRQTRHPSGLY